MGAKCSSPGSVRPDDLIAYIDGEAGPPIAEHIQSCPGCARQAAAYARLQRRLGEIMYRFDCPPAQVLGDYEVQVLPPAERTRIAAHVLECPLCADELRTLRDFLAAEPPPPAEAPSWVRRLVATLLSPAPAPAPAYAGLRGAVDSASRTYQAGDVTVTLRLGLDSARRAGYLNGLIWRADADPEALAGQAVQLIGAGDTASTTAIGELGDFAFDAVEPGVYRLEVSLPDQTIVVEELHIDG